MNPVVLILLGVAAIMLAALTFIVARGGAERAVSRRRRDDEDEGSTSDAHRVRQSAPAPVKPGEAISDATRRSVEHTCGCRHNDHR